jgi:hypothetical protein
MISARTRRSKQYVLRCGTVYLGQRPAARVSDVTRAERFAMLAAARTTLKNLQHGGVFPLPWTIVAVSPAGSRATLHLVEVEQ